MGIAEKKKSQDTKRDCWGGNVNRNPYFDSTKMIILRVSELKWG